MSLKDSSHATSVIGTKFRDVRTQVDRTITAKTLPLRREMTEQAARTERNGRTAVRRMHRAHSPVTDFRGITILQTHAGSSPARKGSQTRMTNMIPMIPMISMMRMHTTAANAGTSARRSSAERAEIRLIFKMISTLPARAPITEQSGADAIIPMMNLNT